MKTKTWIGLLGLLLALSLGLTAWLFWPRSAQAAEIWSEGKLLDTLSLSQDQTLRVETDRGYNVITVQDGRIGVTEADCPGGDCMARGFCAGGAQIVCLPHQLVIRFIGEQPVDAVAG